jgi:hypothetical protein
MSAHDIIRFEEAIACATAEFVLMWTRDCDRCHSFPHSTNASAHVEAIIEEHSQVINKRLREILHSLQRVHGATLSKDTIIMFRREVREALLSTHLKAETVDNLIYAATP